MSASVIDQARISSPFLTLMSINFTLTPTAGPLKGRLTYVSNDYAFRFEPEIQQSTYCSIQINSLQLETDDRGRLLFPRGYCPLLNYKETDLSPPIAKQNAAMIADISPKKIPGVTYALGSSTAWTIWINKNGGWVCLGEPGIDDSCDAVEFANGAIAVICDSQLMSVWLQPAFLPSHLVNR